MSRIAFLGLGNMGLPMAINLARAGHHVTGFDLVTAALTAFAEHGSVAASVAEAVAAAEIVITMLPAGKHVREVYCGASGVLAHAAKGALLIDSSTIDVATAREVTEAAGKAGFAMLDAPVSGGVGGAAAGTLTFMVGGPQPAFAVAQHILAVMGKTIVHCGAAGAGQSAKICNNMILGISMIAVSEAFALADRLGLDHQKLFDVASKSSGQCWSLTSYCPVPGPVPTSPANRDWQPGFAASLMLKDLRLSQEAALASGAFTELGAKATAFYENLVEHGAGGRDFSYAYQFIADLAEGA
jgi:3-hydroxyisobutyrate dehydrogenase